MTTPVQSAPRRRGFRARVERLLRTDPAAKPRVYLDVFRNADPLSLNYWLELLFAAGIATLGLVLNSPAVVIGAMLVSPLMGPILALGLAYAAGDVFLGIRSAVNLLASMVVAVLFSGFLVWLLPFHSPTQEILNRTHPNLLDLGVALLSGLAGSMTLARGGGGGGVTALPGVAIAVALMPPLCTVGFGLGSGFVTSIMSGAGLLFLTNLVAIVFAAFVVFFLLRMDDPAVREAVAGELEQEHLRDPLSRKLQTLGIGVNVTRRRAFEWRVVMLLVVLAALAMPLRQSLTQLRDETVARAAVSDALRAFGSRHSILSRQVDLGADRITIGLLVSEEISPEQITDVEKEITRRAGRTAKLNLVKVARQEEVSSLRRLMETPAAPPPPETVEKVWKEWRPKFDSALLRVWPGSSAPVLDSELVLGPNGPTVRVEYQADRPLDPAALEAIQKGLAQALAMDRVDLMAVPVRKAKAVRATTK